MSREMPGDGAAITVDPEFGRGAPSLGWVPAPRYLLRRDRVLAWMRDLPRGRLLEIGCGAGSLLADLRSLGFACAAVETSATARALASRVLFDHPDVPIAEELDPAWRERFDYLLAFEVLEHIPDDAAALRSWLTCLRPGGRLLLSVPAHAGRWTATDTWAGHVRRYDRSDFTTLVERCGARVDRCENYGFPLANIIEPVTAWARGRQLARAVQGSAETPGRQVRTGQSGVNRPLETRLYPLMTSLAGRIAMRSAFRAQRLFAATELGNGFLLLATKP